MRARTSSVATRAASSSPFVVRAMALAAVIATAQAGARTRTAWAQEGQSSAPRVLTLAAAERAATEQQPQIRVARAQTEVARATAEEVRSPLLPQVVGTAQYAHEWGAFRGVGTTGSAIGSTSTGLASLSNNFDVYSFGVNATQLIYDFGQAYGKYGAAKANVEAQRYAEQVTRLQIVAAVRKAYFTARANKELVDVSRETLSDQDKHLTQVQGFVQVGTQPEIALAQQKAAVANAEVQLIIAQNNYETAKAMLNQSAGLVGGTEYDVSDETIGALPDEDQPLETLVRKAMVTRPELADLEKQRDAQEATARSAKGGYGPTLSASAGASEAGLALDALGPNVNVGLILSWPIFQGGLTVGQVRQAEAGLAGVEAQHALEELQVRLDVNTAQLAVRAAKATIGAADEALTQRARTAAARRAAVCDGRRQHHRAQRRAGGLHERVGPGRAGSLFSGDRARAAHGGPRTNMIHDDPITHAPSRPAPAARRSPATRIVLVLLLVVAVGGTAWILQQRSRKATAAAAEAAKAANDRVIPVLTAQVSQRDVPVTLEGLGNVAAFYTVTVKTQVDGRIDKVSFAEGQRVKKGDLLAQIDPRPFAIQLAVRAGGARARPGQPHERQAEPRSLQDAERRRTSSPCSSTRIRPRRPRSADAQVQADQAQIDTARLNLDYARITSPIDGVTGVRLVDPGNVVHAADTGGLVVVTQLDPIAVLFTLPEDDLPRGDRRRWRRGRSAVDALQPRRRPAPRRGHARRCIDNQINQATATIRLKAIFDNPKQRALAEPVREGAPAARARARTPSSSPPSASSAARRGRSCTSSRRLEGDGAAHRVGHRRGRHGDRREGADRRRAGRRRGPGAAPPGGARGREAGARRGAGAGGGDAVSGGVSEPFIRRPVATTLLMIGLLLAGIVGVPAAAGLRAAAGRLPDDRRLDVPARRQRRHDGVGRDDAARAAVRPDAVARRR